MALVRSVLEPGRERFQPKFSINYFLATLTFAMVSMWCAAAGTVEGASVVSPFKHLFGFGDSFIDTGNRDPNNSTLTSADILVNEDWRYPYGISLGAPVGRFCDGLVFFDFIAAALGLNPVPFRTYVPGSPAPASGVNFAIGGAGVFPSFGFTKTGAQITELEGILATTSVYKPSESVILYSVNGNDYGYFAIVNGATDFLGLLTFVPQVVAQIVADIQRLYNLGFTNIIVTQLPPLGCEPQSTMASNYTACVALENLLIPLHNNLLSSNLSATLPHANIIFLDFFTAFGSIIYAPAGTTGFASPILKPCCAPDNALAGCSYTDSNNQPLYTLCSNPKQTFFWDSEHPTQAGWTKIYFLFLNSSLYSGGIRSLLCYLFPQLC